MKRVNEIMREISSFLVEEEDDFYVPPVSLKSAPASRRRLIVKTKAPGGPEPHTYQRAVKALNKPVVRDPLCVKTVTLACVMEVDAILNNFKKNWRSYQ